MDGAWTGHPDQNEIAVKQFPFPNQVNARKAGSAGATRSAAQPERRRQNHRRRNARGDPHRHSLSQRRAERQRRQPARRLHGRSRDRSHLSTDDRATHSSSRIDVEVEHTPESISRMFDEELDRILSELPADAGEPVIEKYRTARNISELLIRNQEFDPI